MKHSARFLRNSIGLNFEELQEICNFYSVETISGLGDTKVCTTSPDKLIGSGFLVDYITFIRDIDIENDYVPSVAKQVSNARRV